MSYIASWRRLQKTVHYTSLKQSNDNLKREVELEYRGINQSINQSSFIRQS